MQHDNVNPASAPALNETEATATRHGVFYPTGYVVASFSDAVVAKSVFKRVSEESESGDKRLLKPADMLALTAASVEEASVMAKIVSAELKQVERLRQFAEADHSFVIFKRDSLAEEAIDSIVIEADPSLLIHYAMLAIENLLPSAEESPDSSPLGINERGRST